jgi:hypothetical protein
MPAPAAAVAAEPCRLVDGPELEARGGGAPPDLRSPYVNEVSRRVLGWAPRLQNCYEKLLRRDDQAEGHFCLNVMAERDGRVSKVAITESSIGDQPFRQCLADVACSGQLPPPPDRQPLVFAQQVNLTPEREALRKMPPAGPCPAPDEIRKALAVRGDRWLTTCEALKGEGRLLLAALRKPQAGSPELRVAVAIAGGDDSAGPLKLTLQGPEAAQLRAVAERAEDWGVKIARAPAAPKTHLELDLYGTSGDDYFLGEEIVTFVQVEGKRLRAVWSGLGQKQDRRFDSCLLLSVPTFKFLGRELERRVKTTRTFRDAGIDRAEAASLRKNCVAPPEATDRFPLAPPPETPPVPVPPQPPVRPTAGSPPEPPVPPRNSWPMTASVL